MSNLKKRFLAMTLVVLMIAGAVVSTSAATYADVINAEDVAKIELLSALGIVKGTGTDELGDTIFSPDDFVTRQQMALFIARIKSAMPGMFERDENPIPTDFTDVKDATYYKAINYATELGIINGRGNNIFDPASEVTLDEALAMIVRALGYTDLTYNNKLNQTTPKAKQLGFALEYRDNQGSKKLTRIEVMRLLYTYFYSEEQQLEVTTVNGLATTTKTYVSVMSKFGINSIENAYIIAADGYSAQVSAYYKANEKDTGFETTTSQTVALSSREISNGYDIKVAYPTYTTTTTGGETTIKANKDWNVVTLKKSDLGIDADVPGRELVGLKVAYYEDTMKTRDIANISYVSGVRTVTDNSTNSVTVQGDNYNEFKDNEIIINSETLDLRAPADLVDDDIYSFKNTTTLKLYGTDARLTLARTIHQKGYYELAHIDNGEDKYGNDLSFYVFTPFSAGYYNKDDDGYVCFNDSRITGDYKKADLVIDTAAGGTDVGTLTQKEAYLYNIEGKYLYLQAKLVKVATEAKANYVYNKTVMLGSTTFTFDRNTTQFLVKGGYANSIDNFKVGNSYTLYAVTAADTAKPILKWQTAEVSNDRTYGVVVSTNSNTTMINGQVFYVYDIFNSATNSRRQIITTTPKPVEGTAIGYRVADSLNGIYDVWVEGTSGFVKSDHGTDIVSNDSGNSLIENNDYTYVSTNGLLTMLNSEFQAIVTSSTPIIEVSADGQSATRLSSRDTFRARLLTDNAYSKLVVVRGSTNAVSNAVVVIATLATDVVAQPETSGNYAIVTNANLGSGSGYKFGEAYSYKDGKTYPVAMSSSYEADLAVGNVLEISNEDTAMVGMTNVRIATPISNEAQRALTNYNTINGTTSGIMNSILTSATYGENILTQYTKESSVFVDGTDVYSIPTTNLNKVTVKFYTNADFTGTTGGTDTPAKLSDPSTWAKDKNVTISIANDGKPDSIGSNSVAIVAGTISEDSPAINRYYAYVIDGNGDGIADMLTIVEIVVDSSAKTR